MKKKSSQIEKNNSQETPYNVWKGKEYYSNFIRSLYQKSKKRASGKELTLRFLKKLVVVFLGAFFTTLTFYFLIDPNGIYNSGLNGFLQSISKWIIGRSGSGWSNYYLIYYGLGLLTNLLFIFSLWFFFKAKLEIISTSVFYVFFQVIWTQIFKFFNLREFFFNRFNPSSWKGLSSQSQLSFTLPYYIVIAIVAAMIHTYGYSLIFQAQATPGGLEIFTSHFSSQKKSKFSISTLTKIFGIFITLTVTVFNFFCIEDNPKMKESLLQREMQEEKLVTDEKEGISKIIEKWKEDMKRAKEFEEKNNIKESSKIRADNYLLTAFFKNKTSEPKLEKYPEEMDYYLLNNKEKIATLNDEVRKIQTEIKNLNGEILREKLQRMDNLKKRAEELEKETNRKLFSKYLGYVSNNERLWATMVYIFLSSFLISQIFPRNRMILLHLYLTAEEQRNKALRLLRKFSPIYYTVYRKKGKGQEETIFVVNCHLSKWNHYLISPHLKEIGISHVYETAQ